MDLSERLCVGDDVVLRGGLRMTCNAIAGALYWFQYDQDGIQQTLPIRINPLAQIAVDHIPATRA